MQDTAASSGIVQALWIAALVAVVVVAAALLFFWSKGRKLPGPHVFRASRFSRGNLLFPTQVAVTPTSVVHFTPEWFGRAGALDAHRARRVGADRPAPVLLERPDRELGRHEPGALPRAPQADAVEMKRLIEQFQSEYYRGQRPGSGAAGA